MVFVFVVQESVLPKVEGRDGVSVGGWGDGLVAVVAVVGVGGTGHDAAAVGVVGRVENVVDRTRGQRGVERDLERGRCWGSLLHVEGNGAAPCQCILSCLEEWPEGCRLCVVRWR